MKCRNEIDCAERKLLIYSWIGAFSSIAFIIYAVFGGS